MAYATANGIRIYYETEGDGPPLVLLSGYSSDSSHWFTVREELARHFLLVLPDNRGAGRTDCPAGPFSIEDMADDVIGLCETLQIKKPHILGHSLAGAIAQSLGCRYPERIGKVILSQTTMKFDARSSAVIRASLHLVEHGVPLRNQIEMIFPWVYSPALIANVRKYDELIARRQNYPYLSTLDGLKKQFAALSAFDSTDWCAKITVPVLVLGGEEDLLCPAHNSLELAKEIRGAKCHIIPNVGHAISIEMPEEHNQIIRDFLL